MLHRVQLLASDAGGQATLSAPARLRIDGQPPIVAVGLVDSGRGVRVSVRDRASGVKTAFCRVAFGDGAHAKGRKRARHVYARGGLYRIVVQVSDRVGNRAIVHRLVSVR